MKNIKILMFVVLGLVSIQSNCSNSRTLTAQFESDDINSFPDVQLPGDPDGDRILWYGTSDDRLKVVSRTNGDGETSKWLQLDQTTNDPQFYPAILSFIPAPETINSDSYIINWQGNLEVPRGADNLLDISISVSEGQGHGSARIVSFILRPEPMVNGENSRKFGLYLYENESYSEAPLGYVRTGGAHSISIFLFERTRELHIVGLGETIVRNFPDGIVLNRPSLHFIFIGFPGIGVYQMDNITMLKSSRTDSK